MPLVPDIFDLALRIGLTLVAALAIGYERGRAGKAAGLRTTVLVALAACLAMIQVNVLLPQGGRVSDSFIMLDLMRLPLGILTGVGFIGAGAILRRGAMVIGVTTAATMWYVTVLGLLFGGGQLELGIAGAVLGLLLVEVLRVVEARMLRHQRATLSLRLDPLRVDGAEIQKQLAQRPFELVHMSFGINAETRLEDRVFYLRWLSREDNIEVPELVRRIAARDGVISLRWEGGGIADD
jgi:putative Mg2+ transporter-C (MgtC) family protein